jgi:antidote-toxin recognition MazE-like antitoxin
MKRMRAARNAVTIRVRKHREQLRAAGLRPVQLWLPNTASKAFRKKCERESLSLAGDPHEAETLAWIAKVSDTDGWV